MNRSDNSDALKFSPQVAALAMPQDSGFSKAAEGISNVGKVFQDQQDREQTSVFNALKMDVANEELTSKRNENSVFGEKQERERESHLLTKRNTMLDIMKKDIEAKAAHQKALDDDATKQLASWTPKEAYMNADGMPDRTVLSDTKAALLSTPEWKDRGHIVNAWFDTLESNIFKGAKENAEVVYKQKQGEKEAAEAANKIKEGKWIDKEKQAEIYQKTQSGAASGASARKTEMEIKNMPDELAIKKGNLAVATMNSITTQKTENRLASKQLSDVLALDDTEFEKQFPDYARLNDDGEKQEYRETIRRTKGIRKPIIEGDKLKRLSPKSPDAVEDSGSSQTIVNPKTGAKKVLKNGAWVPIK